jgi:UDP-GlcNAc:undecaprenyl-phosphate GlcNAc-1-phosphate transferase
MNHTLLIGLLGFVLSLTLTLVVKRAAPLLGAVARPAADRWHGREVPLLGGVAIAGAVLLGVVLVAPLARDVVILLAGAVGLSVVGLVDDFHPLKPQTKFIAQILVAAMLAGLGLRLGLTGVPVVDLVLTLVWIVGVANAFNLLDNMDGLAAGVAAIATAFRLGFFLNDGNMEAAQIAALLLGSLVGFLVFNFQPASIFMGDAGSLFVGVMVSGLSLVGTWAYSRGTASVLLFPVLILLVPIFDTAFVIVSRTLAGRSIATGGRDHPSHRLVALGLSEREAVLIMYVVACLAGGMAAVSYHYHLSYTASLIALLLIAVGLFGVYLGRLQVYSEDEVRVNEGTRFVTLVANFAYKQQVATVLVDCALIIVAYYSAYVLRFEDAVQAEQGRFIGSLPAVIASQLLAFGAFRVYQGVWRYTSVRDIVTLAQASCVGVVTTVAVLAAMGRLEGYSRAVFVLDWLLLVVLVSGSRLSFRALAEFLRPRSDGLRRVIIYGAGDGGVMVLREVRNNVALQRHIVGFIDDDRSKHRTTVQGVPVLGDMNALAEVIRASSVDEVIISSNKVPPQRVSELSALCDSLEVALMRASLRLE